MFIITDTIQVRTITNFIIPLQSGGALSWCAKLTGAHLFTLDDHITLSYTSIFLLYTE